MKKLILASLLALSLSASAGQLISNCMPETTYTDGDCPAAIEFIADHEALFIDTNAGILHYCPMHGGWQAQSCTLKGRFLILSGELTFRQLVDLDVKFMVAQRLGGCYDFFGKALCSR